MLPLLTALVAIRNIAVADMGQGIIYITRRIETNAIKITLIQHAFVPPLRGD